MNKKVASIVLVVLICISLSGCSIKEKVGVRVTIHEFQSACNEMDAEKMLECIDPTLVFFLQVLPIPKDKEGLNEFVINIIDLLYFIDFDTVNDVVEGLESLKIHVIKIRIYSGKASVDARLSYKIDGEKLKEDITLELVKKRGKWYLTLF
jgi:hypothetical protein